MGAEFLAWACGAKAVAVEAQRVGHAVRPGA